MDDIIERSLRALANTTQSNYKIAKATGLSEAAVGRYKNGKSKPTIVNAKALIQYLEGTMLRSDTTPADGENKQFKSVPLLPAEAVAGFPASDLDGIVYADCDQYMVPEFERSGYEFVIRVSGSSMYPKYSNGDILACKKIIDILFFQWGKVYVIDSSQGALVKRVFEDEDNPDNILLVSDNRENYPPFSMPRSDIRSLSIVLGVIRME
ncbi:MAG: hypothetical protein BGO29_14985 [Bacteroidales bacterium 36-12]|nr:MAG: hypothetical protein BGO29_14985 [Bacteroidales bacterium 36-12]